MTLALLPDRFTVCLLSGLHGVDPSRPFTFLSVTDGEISLVCPERETPASAFRAEPGWRALRVCGTLAFSLTGILAGIAGALADAEISLFALSTFRTDYVLVKEVSLQAAIGALALRGYEVVEDRQ